MAGTNTEQPANKAEQKKTTQVATPKKEVVNKAPVKTEKKTEEKNTEAKKEVVTQVKVKRDYATAYGRSMPVSTKVAVAICKMIKGKTPKKAIELLEAVTKLRMAVPMKGEIAHRKGNLMSGKYPQRAASEFLVLVKNLLANANQNEMEAPVITEAIANVAQRPFGKGGRWKRKRTHVSLKVTEKKSTKKTNKKE